MRRRRHSFGLFLAVKNCMKDSKPRLRRRVTPSSRRYFDPSLFSILHVFMRLETTLGLAYDIMMWMMSMFTGMSVWDSALISTDVLDRLRDDRSR